MPWYGWLILLYALQLRLRTSYFIERYWRKDDLGVAHHIRWVEKELKWLRYL